MILEHADIRIDPANAAAFEEAILRGANTVIATAKGFRGFNRPLKKSMRVQKMVISGVPHPLPTLEKSLVGRSERSAFGSASFLGTFSTAC